MIEQQIYKYQLAEKSAENLYVRQQRRYQADCQKLEGTYRPFSREELLGITEEDDNWKCVREFHINDAGKRV